MINMNNRQQKKVVSSVKSLQEMRDYVSTLKPCYNSRALKRFLDAEIRALKDPKLHAVRITMTKEKYVKYLKL